MTAPRATAASLLGALVLSLSVGPAAASPPGAGPREHRETRPAEPHETLHGPPASPRAHAEAPAAPAAPSAQEPAAPAQSAPTVVAPATSPRREGPTARHGDAAHARRSTGSTDTAATGSTDVSTAGSRDDHGPPAARHSTGASDTRSSASAGSGSSGSASAAAAAAAAGSGSAGSSGAGSAGASAAGSATPATSGPAVAATGSALAPATPASPGTTTLPATRTRALSSGGARHRHSARALRRRRGSRLARAPHNRGIGHAVGALASASALHPKVAPLSRHAGRRAREDGSSPTPHSPSSSPLITTVTRIVNVVPPLMRLIVALLVALALALGARSGFIALRARRLEHHRRQLLDDVGLLQAALLPDVPAQLESVPVSAAYQPAEGPGAGGDFYDIFALPSGRLAIILGDVSGHGRAALPHTALIRFTLRAYLEAGLAPRVALDTAAAVLERQLSGVFATVLLATFDPDTHTLVFACAGHPPPVVVPLTPDSPPDPTPWQALTVSSAPPLGVGLRTGTRQTTLHFSAPSLVCFHTDGLTEARVSGDLYGEHRLRRALASLGPAATASSLLARVAATTDARPDDMAACLLHAAAGRVEAAGGSDGRDGGVRTYSVFDADRARVRARGEGWVTPATSVPPTSALGPPVLATEEELVVDRDDALCARTTRLLLACGLSRSRATDIQHAAAAAGRVGTAVLHIRVGAGDAAPHVELRCDDVAVLAPPTHVPDLPRVGAPL